MKTSIKLALIVIVMARLASANYVAAEDSNLAESPKVKANRISWAKPVGVKDPDLIHTQSAIAASPKVLAMQPKNGGSSKNDPNLIAQQRSVVYTGRSPFEDYRQNNSTLAGVQMK